MRGESAVLLSSLNQEEFSVEKVESGMENPLLLRSMGTYLHLLRINVIFLFTYRTK